MPRNVVAFVRSLVVVMTTKQLLVAISSVSGFVIRQNRLKPLMQQPHVSNHRSHNHQCLPQQSSNQIRSEKNTLYTTERLQSALSNDEIRRYSRHLVLSDVGVKGQELLKDAAVLVVGAGGLGSPALLYLAAAGVGHIGIVDADTVDESNLQRQIIHSVSTVGKSKCESAKMRILDINPHVHVRLYDEEFTSFTAERILGQGYALNKPWQVVIDGSDNFPTKYLIK